MKFSLGTGRCFYLLCCVAFLSSRSCGASSETSVPATRSLATLEPLHSAAGAQEVQNSATAVAFSQALGPVLPPGGSPSRAEWQAQQEPGVPPASSSGTGSSSSSAVSTSNVASSSGVGNDQQSTWVPGYGGATAGGTVSAFNAPPAKPSSGDSGSSAADGSGDSSGNTGAAPAGPPEQPGSIVIVVPADVPLPAVVPREKRAATAEVLQQAATAAIAAQQQQQLQQLVGERSQLPESASGPVGSSGWSPAQLAGGGGALAGQPAGLPALGSYVEPSGAAGQSSGGSWGGSAGDSPREQAAMRAITQARGALSIVNGGQDSLSLLQITTAPVAAAPVAAGPMALQPEPRPGEGSSQGEGKALVRGQAAEPAAEVTQQEPVPAVVPGASYALGEAAGGTGYTNSTEGQAANGGLHAGAVAAVVVAASVAIILVVLLACLLVRRRRRRRKARIDSEAGAPGLVPHASLALLSKRELQLAKTGAGPVTAAPGAASHLPPGEDPGLPSPSLLSPLSSLTSDSTSPPLSGPPWVSYTQTAQNLGPDSTIPPSPVTMTTSLSPAGGPSQGVAADSSSTGYWKGDHAGGDGAEGGFNPLFRGGPSLPWTEGVLRREQIEILRQRDGTPWTLGRGACGTVYKALLDGVQPVAVKVVQGMGEPRMRDTFVREVTLLRAARNRNVVQFLGACLAGEEALLAIEYCEMGDLWKLAPLRSAASGQRVFGWGGRGQRVALDVARGLHYLHSRKVVHLDLKSANILIARDGTAKIADVGFSRVLSHSYFSITGAMGTFAWSAPEVLQGQRCTERSDIYSFGVVLWEICTGLTPIRGDMRDLRVPEDCPAEVADLYRRCTNPHPANRPTAREIVGVLQGLGGASGRQAHGEDQLIEAAAAAVQFAVHEGEAVPVPPAVPAGPAATHLATAAVAAASAAGAGPSAVHRGAVRGTPSTAAASSLWPASQAFQEEGSGDLGAGAGATAWGAAASRDGPGPGGSQASGSLEGAGKGQGGAGEDLGGTRHLSGEDAEAALAAAWAAAAAGH